MTTQTNTNIRRGLSLAAFTTFIAAVTLAFASPTPRTAATFSQPEAAVSFTPHQPVLLAQATVKKKRPLANSSSIGDTSTINLNKATEAELIALPGIGPKKAAVIVEWRKKHGKFRRVVDLRRVKGFGAKTVKKLQPYLRVE